MFVEFRMSSKSEDVPILTQSEDWALYQHIPRISSAVIQVPILTQSEDWALLAIAQKSAQFPTKFQSSPSPKTGRYLIVQRSSTITGSVPILTQSEDWAL